MNQAKEELRDRDGNTPLHIAAEQGNVEQARVLIEDGADINALNLSNRTPLIEAAIYDKLSVAKLLLDRGADVHECDALRRAAVMAEVEFAKMLIDHGALVNVADGEDSPLHLAISQSIQWKGLKEKECLLLAKLLIEKGANIEAKDRNGETPLQSAVACGALAAVKLLIENGADIHAKDILHKTPLENAKGEIKELVKEQILARSSLHLAAAADDVSAIKLLINNKVDINKPREGKTPLHWAVTFKKYGASKILLEKGADVNSEDKEGSTPLKIAKRNHYKNLIKLLKEYGGTG